MKAALDVRNVIQPKDNPRAVFREYSLVNC